MSSRVNEVDGENLQDPQSKFLATPMNEGVPSVKGCAAAVMRSVATITVAT